MARIKLYLLVSFLALFGMLQSASPLLAQGRAARVKPAKVKPFKAKAAKAAKATAKGVKAKAVKAGVKGAGKVSTGAKARKSFQVALKSGNASFYVREVNGTKRVIANISGTESLEAVAKVMGKSSNVIQILHFGDTTGQHSLAIFDGELVHAQYISGTSNWRLGVWGNKLRASNHKMFSAFIALTPGESAIVRKNIKQGRKDQGPDHLAGPNWENGKLKNTSMGGCRSFNCTSVWASMPLNKAGETLGQIAGVGTMFAGAPRALQKNLETQGNDRVIGVAIYGPRVQGFGTNKEQPVTDL